MVLSYGGNKCRYTDGLRHFCSAIALICQMKKSWIDVGRKIILGGFWPATFRKKLPYPFITSSLLTNISDMIHAASYLIAQHQLLRCKLLNVSLISCKAPLHVQHICLWCQYKTACHPVPPWKIHPYSFQACHR